MKPYTKALLDRLTLLPSDLGFARKRRGMAVAWATDGLIPVISFQQREWPEGLSARYVRQTRSGEPFWQVAYAVVSGFSAAVT